MLASEPLSVSVLSPPDSSLSVTGERALEWVDDNSDHFGFYQAAFQLEGFVALQLPTDIRG